MKIWYFERTIPLTYGLHIKTITIHLKHSVTCLQKPEIPTYFKKIILTRLPGICPLHVLANLWTTKWIDLKWIIKSHKLSEYVKVGGSLMRGTKSLSWTGLQTSRTHFFLIKKRKFLALAKTVDALGAFSLGAHHTTPGSCLSALFPSNFFCAFPLWSLFYVRKLFVYCP